MSDEHSRLSPSAMSRILPCPGSAVDNPPDRSTDASNAGTHSHGLAQRILDGELVDDSEYRDDDQRRSVFEYVSYVKAFREHAELSEVDHEDCQTFIERRLISKEQPDHGGTIDALIVTKDYLYVNDFKDGVMPVNPEDNKQLLSYLVLADEHFPGRKRFFGSIIQPRIGVETKCVEYTREQLDEHAFAVDMAADDDTLKAGAHCKWCPLARTCAERKREQEEVLKLQLADDWTPDECKRIIAMAEVVSTMAKDALKQIETYMKGGVPVEGYKLVQTLTNRKWRDEDEVILWALESDLPDHVIYAPRKLKSPAQLEKFSKAYKKFTAEHAHREEKGVSAVPADSKLPEWKPGDEFTDLPMEEQDAN